MDFLSAIPAPKAPMPPLEPGPDGTPPLPLSAAEEAPVPSRSVFEDTPAPVPQTAAVEPPEGMPMTDETHEDVFESDPFFNPDSAKSDTDDSQPFEPDESPVDDLPVITLEQEPPIPPTAEERLLHTIVGDPTPAEAPPAKMAAAEEELARLRAELERLFSDRNTLLAARDQAKQDLQIFRTRFSTLEADLAAARTEAGKANQLKLQAETRHADAERQWKDKLAHLRGMLDEVEAIRDELNTRRVPKMLFIGTLVAGLLAVIFAYFIGAGTARTPEISPRPPETPRAPQLLVTPPVKAKTPTEPPAHWPAAKTVRWTTPSATGVTNPPHISATPEGRKKTRPTPSTPRPVN